MFGPAGNLRLGGSTPQTAPGPGRDIKEGGMMARRCAGMLAVLLGVFLQSMMPGLAWGAAIAKAPAFAPAPGTFSGPVTVTISSQTAGATIYYSTDGSAPSRQKSPVYKGPVKLSATATLKAIAFKSGLRASPTTS